jgi:hypothetical protein
MIKILEQLQALDLEDGEATPMTLEVVNGQVYAYNQLTGEFLAQAQTVAQVAQLVSDRFPNKRFCHKSLKESQTA